MPGKSSHLKQGEKFSYLVVQKRIFRDGEPTDRYDDNNPFRTINVVELLSQSLDAGLRQKGIDSNQNLHLERALSIEDQYVDSTLDKLGLELVRGENRKNFGRIIRSPIKKKGHVIIDYCSHTSDGEDSQVGRIVRSKISRAQSLRCAPGMYSSSRKARWGGFWPDVTSKKN